ncbi:MAG: NMD3-related protein [Candidatus Nanoarchaeia archaeon]
MNKLLKGARWEGVIQVRPKNKQVITFIRNQVGKRNDAKISRELFFKYGADIYITSQKVTRDIGRKLKNCFDGQLIVTKKIYGRDRQKSKSLYRATVLFRLKPKEQ